MNRLLTRLSNRCSNRAKPDGAATPSAELVFAVASMTLAWPLFRPSFLFKVLHEQPAFIWGGGTEGSYLWVLLGLGACALALALRGAPPLCDKPSSSLLPFLTATACLGALLAVGLGFIPQARFVVPIAGTVYGASYVALWRSLFATVQRWRRRGANLAVAVSFSLNCLYSLWVLTISDYAAGMVITLSPLIAGALLFLARRARAKSAESGRSPESGDDFELLEHVDHTAHDAHDAHDARTDVREAPLLRPELAVGSQTPDARANSFAAQAKGLLSQTAFYLVSLYIGAIVWSSVLSTLDQSVTLVEHLITCVVSLLLIVPILLGTRLGPNAFPASGRTVLILLLILALFLLQLLQSEHVFMATGVVMAVMRCLKLMCWLALMDRLVCGAGHFSRLFGFSFLLLETLPTLLGNILLPRLFVQLVPSLDKELVNTLALTTMLLLVIAIVIFYNGQMRAANEELARIRANEGRKMGYKEACRRIAQSNGLSPREENVLMMVAKGNSQKKIAEDLLVAEGTVRGYVRTVYAKTKVHSRQELIDLVQAERARGAEAQGGEG